ncbi:MAG: UvrD-helicase domain-containing protein [Stigonema ocellatum SAG 48.90 = DSM 106950]|nr:UvrD-helicase domain-containing protein [Stigonema ocellatum SAG 48.90 = DSM 106950]
MQFERTAKSEWDWRSRSVFVVGDADQSIYSFRMADFTLPILEDGNGSRVMVE